MYATIYSILAHFITRPVLQNNKGEAALATFTLTLMSKKINLLINLSTVNIIFVQSIFVVKLNNKIKYRTNLYIGAIKLIRSLHLKIVFFLT